jgi:hypothetical protein
MQYGVWWGHLLSCDQQSRKQTVHHDIKDSATISACCQQGIFAVMAIASKIERARPHFIFASRTV